MSAQSGPGSTGGVRQKQLVLVVDDLQQNVEILEAKLYREGFDTIHAFSGRSALQAAEEQFPDIILLDVMMPRMDGFEVCRRLKANPRTTEIPIILLTALSDSADRSRGFEAGADDVLSKPLGDDVLFARVRSLLHPKR